MSETASPSLPNLPEYSVGELSAALKQTVEQTFPLVRVRGEISGLKVHSSGHVYFDLKDERATLNAVIWKGTARGLRVKPQSGLEVVCTGRVSTYMGSSRYQIIVEQVELAGAGALMAMLETRRLALAAEGLFDSVHKKKLPFLPEVIGVVTSPTGAVIRDIMHRLAARFPRRVLLWPVAVQGERAAAEIAAAIRGFNALAPGGGVPKPDLIIVARGGGSVEDLMAFNEEIAVRAVFESAIPLISAVGHETDTTLIDFVADLRAPTPTAAAEFAVPVRAELIAQTLDYERRMMRRIIRHLEERRRHLAQLSRVLPRPEQLFAAVRQRLDMAAAGLRPKVLFDGVALGRERVRAFGERGLRAHRERIARARHDLDALARILEGVSYRAVIERGFVLVRGTGGAIRRRAAEIMPGEKLTLGFADGVAEAQASGKRTPSAPKPPEKQGSLF